MEILPKFAHIANITNKCSLVLTIIFAVIFLGETLTWKTVLGSILLLAGTFVMIL